MNVYVDICPQTTNFRRTAHPFTRSQSCGHIPNSSCLQLCLWTNRTFTDAFLWLSNHLQLPQEVRKGPPVPDHTWPWSGVPSCDGRFGSFSVTWQTVNYWTGNVFCACAMSVASTILYSEGVYCWMYAWGWNQQHSILHTILCAFSTLFCCDKLVMMFVLPFR